jgi:hypothetical protein
VERCWRQIVEFKPEAAERRSRPRRASSRHRLGLDELAGASRGFLPPRRRVSRETGEVSD